jgi:hypothetical protein
MKKYRANSPGPAILALFFAMAALSACSNSLMNVRTELAKGGFALWYPAEMGIKPGQIWQIKGQTKTIICDQPPGLPIWGPYQIIFESLKKQVNAGLSLEADFGEGLLSNVGPLAAELKKSTVTSVSLDFGDTKVERLIIGLLLDEKVQAALPDFYRKCLERLGAGNRDYVLIGAVVSTAGMKYIFTCDDANSLAANASAIAKLLGIDFNVKIVSKKEAVWEIPEAARMAIGIQPVTGDMLPLTPAQNLRALRPVLLNKELSPSDLITALEYQVKIVKSPDKKPEDIR